MDNSYQPEPHSGPPGSIYSRIKILIEDTNDAFSAYGSLNTDYAEFATLSLADFKSILNKPDMTKDELVANKARRVIRHQAAEAVDIASEIAEKA